MIHFTTFPVLADSSLLPSKFGTTHHLLPSLKQGVSKLWNESSISILLHPTPSSAEPADQALVTAFDMLLEKKIVTKAAFAAWFQQHKAKHPSCPRTVEDFFKKRVLV